MAGPTISDSYRRLRAAQKPAKGAPLYSRLVNRPLGRVFASVAHKLGLTPNQVTVISAILTYAAIATLFLSPPTPPTALGVTLGLVLGYALDAADGQLARLRGGGSLAGEWLDHVIDSGKIATLHLGVAVLIYRFYDVSHTWIALPLAFGAVGVVHFFGMLLTELLTRVEQANRNTLHSSPAKANNLVAALKLPTDYGVLCLIFLLLPFPGVFLVSYGILAIAMAGYTGLVLLVWYRRMRQLDRERTGG